VISPGQPVQSFSLRFYAAAAFLFLSGVRARLALSSLPVFLRQIACLPGQRFGLSPFSSSLAVLPFWRQRALPISFLLWYFSLVFAAVELTGGSCSKIEFLCAI
jgi:hypothetical protein